MISLILIALAILPLIMTLIKMNRISAFKKKAVSTTARVTQVEKQYGFRGNIYYMLTLEYQAMETGALFITHTPTLKKYEPGNTIPLMYLPGDPVKFSIDHGKRLPYILAFTILFFLLILWFCTWLNGLEYTVR